MVNGFRYYRALESVSIASALSTALTIYPCQIGVEIRWFCTCACQALVSFGSVCGYVVVFLRGGLQFLF